uniref:Uncharacterized protein n=1 Tax=Rhizophora mucronata TaxID=61149 RepID=A0A2P2Q398_RHIMU
MPFKQTQGKMAIQKRLWGKQKQEKRKGNITQKNKEKKALWGIVYLLGIQS